MNTTPTPGDLSARLAENDDPRDEEYRAHSGGAAVAIAMIFLFLALCLQGAFQ